MTETVFGREKGDREGGALLGTDDTPPQPEAGAMLLLEVDVFQVVETLQLLEVLVDALLPEFLILLDVALLVDGLLVDLIVDLIVDLPCCLISWRI